jgi:hypothetical protein
VKVAGDEVFLLVSREINLNKYTVEAVPTLKGVYSKWTSSTRLAKLFPLDGAQLPDFAKVSHVALYFVGPLDPGRLDVTVPTFLTLGTYNIVLCASNKRDDAKILKFLERLPDMTWEAWTISKLQLLSLRYAPTLMKPNHRGGMTPRDVKVPAALTAADEENALLLTATIAKSKVYFPQNVRDFEVLADGFRRKLNEEGGKNDINRLSWLVNVNAHLSRYTSQAFAGVSPIVSSECHYWSNSLLGIGTAAQALVNVRKFVESAVGSFDFVDRIDAMKSVSAEDFFKGVDGPDATRKSASLYGSAAFDFQYWKRVGDFLEARGLDRPSEATPENSDHDNDRLPLIVCFSGRDGFRSTLFSLTAPLELIAGCNAYGWSPMTLSHEICHVWTNGIFGALFSDLDDPNLRDRLYRLFDGSIEPTTLFEELQFAFYFCVHQLYLESESALDGPAPPAEKQLTSKEKIDKFESVTNEVITHVLFFQREEEPYIRSIWSSWDVIPNIRDRLSDYIVRSGCALLSDRLGHGNEPWKLALDDLGKLLDDLAKNGNSGNYLRDAAELLADRRVQFEKSLQARAQLVRLVVAFLTDTGLAARLQHDIGVKGGDGKAYDDQKPLDFQAPAILNALQFARHFCTDKVVNSKKSMWILQRMAFAMNNE